MKKKKSLKELRSDVEKGASGRTDFAVTAGCWKSSLRDRISCQMNRS